MYNIIIICYISLLILHYHDDFGCYSGLLYNYHYKEVIYHINLCARYEVTLLFVTEEDGSKSEDKII